MLALLERQKTGRGQLLDVSMHEACAVNVELANPYWFYPRVHVHRQTCRHAQPSPTQPALFRCADDRYVYFALILSRARRPGRRCRLDGLARAWPSQLTEPAFSDVAYRQEHFHEVQELVECFFLIQDSHDAYHEGQAAGLPIGVLNAPEDLFGDEHLKARGLLRRRWSTRAWARRSIPGRSTASRPSARSRAPRAPKLGEHTAERARRRPSARTEEVAS